MKLFLILGIILVVFIIAIVSKQYKKVAIVTGSTLLCGFLIFIGYVIYRSGSINDFLGVIYYSRGECQKAVQEFDNAVNLQPKNEYYISLRGDAYAKMGEHKKAIEDYNKAIGLNSKHSSFFAYRGVSYAKLGDQQRAVDDCNRAIELEPNEKELYAMRAFVYESLRKLDLAKKDWEKAHKLGYKLNTWTP